MNPSPPPLAGLLAFLPFFLICGALAVLIAFVAKRKGRSPLVALLAFVPLVNGLYALWLCSLTDVSVLREIEELRRRMHENVP